MRTRLYSLDELEDIPGTTVFNAIRSHQAYHLHKFCMSLMQEANREAFRADERAYLDRFRMSEEQKQAVLDRDFTRLAGDEAVHLETVLHVLPAERQVRRRAGLQHAGDRRQLIRDPPRGRGQRRRVGVAP